MVTIALEWISSQEVEPRDVVQLIQQLKNVPENAVCEVGDIFSRRYRTKVSSAGNNSERRIRNEVHLSCEPVVASFLSKKFSSVLPIDKVIALIDLLGDQVVDAQEAYEIYTDADARTPQRMTLLVESLRYLLSKLITANNIGARCIPSATTVPFLSYTDFLACYVAFLANLHTS
ncbi:hypothetical protein PHMEG_0006530 [Phytophthora megakarya]|uniref:Uncharacterized protein n=1 Tax=Phytophthora megakarya TaxID=4795 RepID=A0A225WNR1_9STRA|nr:hypothetical protein PHMEG_0006530 [Phytophthora megakarya]